MFVSVRTPSAVKRLWGSGDHSVDKQEILQEHAALQDVKVHTVMELLQSRSVRWEVLSLIVIFTAIQMSGSNAVSDTQEHFTYV